MRERFPASLSRFSRRDWAAIALVWIATVAASLAYLSTANRIYRVDVILATVEQDDFSAALGGLPSQLSSLAEIVGTGSGSNSEIALATLSGRAFTESFVREQNLLPRLFPDRWNDQAKAWKGRAPTPSDSYRLVEHGGVRQVIRDRRSGLITLRLEHSDRELIATMATGMVSRVNDILRMKAAHDATASIQYLSHELESQPLVEVRASINRLIEAQIKRRMLAHVQTDYALAIVDFAGVPDESDNVRPRRVLIVANAAVVGLILGVAAIVLPPYFRRSG